MDAAGCCLEGPSHEATGCRTLGGQRASASSLVGRVRVLKTLGLLSTHWRVKQDLGLMLDYWDKDPIPESLIAVPKDPRVHFKSWGIAERVPDTVGYEVWDIPLVDKARAQLVLG